MVEGQGREQEGETLKPSRGMWGKSKGFCIRELLSSPKESEINKASCNNN